MKELWVTVAKFINRLRTEIPYETSAVVVWNFCDGKTFHHSIIFIFWIMDQFCSDAKVM